MSDSISKVEEIDFVITWVDMNDPKWQNDFANYSGKINKFKNEVTEARFRDYGLLKYWFRGVEKFAPWVRKIHFVTCGQKPEWLDPNHPKIQMVDHKDYIPNEFLPVFNSSLIEIYLHKIPNLAEKFVYFNDDFFIINHLKPERFFKNNLVNDIAAFRTNLGMSLWSKCLKNNIRVINQHFDKKAVFKIHSEKWLNPMYANKAKWNYILLPYNKFITLRTPHNAQPYTKQLFREVWDKVGVELTEMSHNRFRSPNDFTQELFRTWQICSGEFNPYNTYNDTKMFPLIFKTKKAVEAIRNQSYTLVCINDNEHIKDFENTTYQLQEAFDSILSEKSKFEL